MNAYEVNALKRRGIVVSRLGCVMLDVSGPKVSRVLPNTWLYHSTHPDRRWITGAQDEGHVTLLYGLLDNANTIREDIDEVLAGWEPGIVQAARIGVFPSPFDDEPYSCIVAHLEVTDELKDAHARLSLLPHIDTHPEYKPHVTLAYVRREDEGAAVHLLEQELGCVKGALSFHPLGLNYGYPPS
jgi:2'-5' RNA ligase